MSKISIPEFWEVDEKKQHLGEDKLDPLEKFIHDYTPQGMEEEPKFYKDLHDVLQFVVKVNTKPTES